MQCLRFLLTTGLIITTITLVSAKMGRDVILNFSTSTFLKAIVAEKEILVASPNIESSGAMLAMVGVTEFRQAEFELAKKNFLLAQELEPGRASIAVQLGNTYFALNEFDKALEAWNKIATVDSNWLKHRGRFMAAIRDWHGSMEYYRLATELNPQDAQAFERLAEIQERLLLLTEAAKSYSAAASVHADPYQRALLNAKAFLLRRDWENARMALGLAQQISPDQAEPYLKLGYTLYWGYHELDQAIVCFNRALELAPTNAMPYVQLIQIYSRENRYSDADQWYERGKALFPEDLGILYQGARSQLQRGNYWQALEIVEQILEFYTTYPHVWDLRGQIMTRLERRQEALSSYMRAKSLAPTEGLYTLHYAEALFDNGDICEALNEAKVAERLSPTLSAVIAGVAYIRSHTSSICNTEGD